MDSLAMLVSETLRENPFSGALFVFRSKRMDRVKILAWDGSGLVLYYKRLEAHRFTWPPIRDGVEISKRSALAEAIRYTLGRWDGLTRFLDDGRIEIDNNVVERSIKPVALGRKSSLFAGSIRGAQNWAILASLINTAKLNDVEPQAWLTDVLKRIVSGRTTINRLHELLPWTWKADHTIASAIAA